MSEATLDPERQVQARQYARIQRRLMLVDLGIGVVYLLAWLAFGWSQALKDWLLGWTSSEWLLVAAFAVVFGAIIMLIDLPLSYYEGYILPHRFGLSNQTLPGWITDQLKSSLVGGVFGLFVLEVIYAVLRLYPETWWLWAAGLLLVFDVVLSTLAPVLIFPIFNKYTPLGEEHAGLVERLMKLAEQAHTRVTRRIPVRLEPAHQGRQRSPDRAGQHTPYHPGGYAAERVHRRRDRDRAGA